ncbi:MAG: hypothetical protein ACRD40_06470 [Candidatus Acidiferrales bacterium]
MAYEVFTRKITRSGTPRLSFTKLGQIFFNQPAAHILNKETVEYVLLLWDEAAHKIAIKNTSNRKDTRAYKLRYNDKGNGASFSAKTFLDFVGIDLTERHMIPVEITPNNEYLLEVKIPSEFFRGKQQPLRLEKVKAQAG